MPAIDPSDTALVAQIAGSSCVADLQITDWGYTIQLRCMYLPLESSQGYIVTFHQCVDVQYAIYRPDYLFEPEPTADIAGFSLGRGDGQEAMLIHTDIFELSARYGHVTVDKTGSWPAHTATA